MIVGEGKVMDYMQNNENSEDKKSEYVFISNGCIYYARPLFGIKQKKATSDERIRNAMIYINRNFDSHLYINSIADKVYMSRSHFCRLFKEETGESPSEYINYVRIQCAAKLLKESDSSIEEIALACGFNSHSYFSAKFKKQLMMSPREYRNKQANM